jgi:hypothetical protein
VLAQPDCLELLVADGGSTDGSLATLAELAACDSRLKVHSEPDDGPADALNKAFRRARGTLIGWLNTDDLYTPGALQRAVAALVAHREWLMVYGEGEEFDATAGLRRRYPTLPPEFGLEQFRSHCFICQPTVVFRRTMAVLLGPFDCQWQTAFDFDYWLRAFRQLPLRIGYLPHLQARTRLHDGTITSRQRALVALEASQLLARYFGSAAATRLHSYALELQLGHAFLPDGSDLNSHLTSLADQAAAWIDPKSLAGFRQTWLLDPTTAPEQRAAETAAAALQLNRQLPVQLLQALHPSLRLEAPGPPAGPHQRLLQAIASHRKALTLLQQVPLPSEPSPSSLKALPSSSLQFSQRPFGVNLIGHAFEMFGIGEDIRMAALALQAAGVPCCVIHHPARNGAACDDRSLEPLLCTDASGGPYAFNLVCLAAPIQARWLLERGLQPLREHYTISSWPWETQRWPSAWLPLLQVTDELWPSSRFTAAALEAPAAAAGLPLQLMPMAADLPSPERFCNPEARRATRRRHQLPADAVLFGYGFDLNSTASRKNPIGALEAFQLAFPAAADPCPGAPAVALMIKTFPPRRFSPEWHWLQARAAKDARIHLVVADLERDDLLSLYGACDVFLSLHRSEGFGRGIAETLQLGLDVIATDYGGNVDFCTGPLAHPVRYSAVPIPRGAYPCADGHSWAEADLPHAAELMRAVAARRLAIAADPQAAASDPSRDPEVLSTYRQRFAAAAAGARYRARLETLWAQRHELAGRLQWRADTPA